MNKELKNKYIKSVLETTFRNDEKMGKYFEKDISDVVKVSAGLLAFRKPSIQTRFCYSYDEVMDCYSGTNTYQEALKACNVQEKTFLQENLEDMLKRLKELQEEKTYFINAYYNNNQTVQFVSQGYADRFPSDIVAEATEEDVEVLIEALNEEIEKFTKRLKTYLKRYGTSKLRTWTYSIND